MSAGPPDFPPRREDPEQMIFDFTLSPGAAIKLPDTSRFPRLPDVTPEPPKIDA